MMQDNRWPMLALAAFRPIMCGGWTITHHERL